MYILIVPTTRTKALTAKAVLMTAPLPTAIAAPLVATYVDLPATAADLPAIKMPPFTVVTTV